MYLTSFEPPRFIISTHGPRSRNLQNRRPEVTQSIRRWEGIICHWIPEAGGSVRLPLK